MRSLLYLVFLHILTNFSTITKSSDFQRDDRENNGIFTVDYNKTLHSITPFAVFNISDVFECSWKCTQHLNCWSFNLANKKIENACQLLSTYKYNYPLINNNFFHHYTLKKSCDDKPCKNGGTCVPNHEIQDYHCNCKADFTGKNCEWRQLNSVPVCFSAKGDKYGAITTFAGNIKAIQLVHVSGLIHHWWSDKGGYWGGGRKSLGFVITDINNVRLSPPSHLLSSLSYKLPGVTNMDRKVTLPELSPQLTVAESQELRLWDIEDLTNTKEIDNRGTSCTNVLAYYEQ